MIDLTSFESFTAYNGAVPSSDEAGVKALITAYSRWFRTETSRDITVESYSRRFDGQNNTRLIVPQYPVVSVISVTIGARGISAQLGPGQPGFYFDEDSIILDSDRFERGNGNIQVAWTAGYDPIPADVSQAINELVGLRYALRDKQGWVSKTLAGETVALSTRAMPDSVRCVVDNYRSVVSR